MERRVRIIPFIDGARRACDRCKRRKIKCDAATPRCRACDRSHSACTWDSPTRRRGPKPRVIDSSRNQLRSEGELSAAPISSNSISPRSDDLPSFDGPNATSTSELTAVNELELVNSGALLTTSADSPSLSSADDPSLLSADGQTPLNVWEKIDQLGSSSVTADHDLARYQRLLPEWMDKISSLILENLPAFTIKTFVEKCLDLFFLYYYPIAPMLNETLLRQDFKLLLDREWPSAGISGHVHWHLLSTFSLMTALCAEVSYLISNAYGIFPQSVVVAKQLLQASRDALYHYQDEDLEQPTARSMAIRFLHSNCLHALGRYEVSWYLFAEAVQISQMLRLHDESSYEGLDKHEAESRRGVFWVLHATDRSTVLLNKRPYLLRSTQPEFQVTVKMPVASSEFIAGDEHHQPWNPQQNLMIINGFNLATRLWDLAAEVVLHAR